MTGRACVAGAEAPAAGQGLEVPSLQSGSLQPQLAAPAPGNDNKKTRAVLTDRILLACLLAVPIGVTAWFLPYYLLDRGGRVRSPLDPLLNPARPVGLAFGVAGLSLFLFMWLYPMRKRVRVMHSLGGVGTWLRIHVVVGLALPVIVAVHAGWRFHGLIGLGYFAMLLVSLSGVVGRYLYSHIPRHRNGLELTRDEVANERRALLTRIAAEAGLNPVEVEFALSTGPARAGRTGLGRVFLQMVTDDLARRRALRRIRRRWMQPRPGAAAPDPKALKGTMKLARREIKLDQQVRMLDATHRIFRWWHVAHLPVALTAVLAVLVHVVVALVVGGVRLP